MNFLHTADWQLGKPFARIEDPDKAARVRSERIEAIRRIAGIAAESKVDFVIVAGDVFDSFTASRSVVSAACSAIGEIGVPVVAIPGNHDHGGPGCLWEQEFFLRERESLAPNLHVLLEAAPVSIAGATILPAPLLRRHVSGDPTAWIRELDFPSLPDPDQPRIVLAHGSVHGFDGESGAGDEDGDGGISNFIALDRLPREEIDYVALGDWHGTKEIDASAWYSGAPEIDRFPRGDDNRPGHVLVVETDRDAKPSVDVRPTGKLGWHTVDFEFAADSDVEKLDEQLDDLLGARAGEDLLHLTATGSLGFAGSAQWRKRIETLESRLLRLKLTDRVRPAPTEEEVATLTERSTDPLIARVATRLLEESSGEDENAEIARTALRELHLVCSD